MTTCLAHTSNTVIFIVRHICWKLYCISLKALHLWPHVPDFQQCVMGCLECNHIKHKHTWSVPCGLGILILQNTLCSLVWTVLFCVSVSVCDYLASIFTCLSAYIYTHKLYFTTYVLMLALCVWVCLMHHSDVSHLVLPWGFICSGKCVFVCMCVCLQPQWHLQSVWRYGGSLLWCFHSDNAERWNPGIWYRDRFTNLTALKAAIRNWIEHILVHIFNTCHINLFMSTKA